MTSKAFRRARTLARYVSWYWNQPWNMSYRTVDRNMSAREAAEYLGVSEATVCQWARNGDIPGTKNNLSWRFSRRRLNRWLRKRLARMRETLAMGRRDLNGMLKPERVFFLDFQEKEEVLNVLVDYLAGTGDRAVLAGEIFRRERVKSTGIGFGIGLPHARVPWLNRPCIAAAVCRRGIPDYESVDGRPVQLVVMLVSGDRCLAEYLDSLAAITQRLRNEELRKRLLTVTDAASFCELFADGEGHRRSVEA